MVIYQYHRSKSKLRWIINNYKYLAIDYGQRRIGLAGSQSGLIPQPLAIIDRGYASHDNHKIFEAIRGYDPETIVVGLPLNDDGTDSNWTRSVREFIKELETEFSQQKIGIENEYLTSSEAKIRSGRKENEPIDDYSALIILEQYLAAQAKRSSSHWRFNWKRLFASEENNADRYLRS